MNLSAPGLAGICGLCETTDATREWWSDAEYAFRRARALHGAGSYQAIEAGHVSQAALERWISRTQCPAKHEEQL
jgi:hypothetical protein